MTEIYNKARQFAIEHIAPYAEEIDRSEKFPHEIFDKIGEAGFLKVIIPKEDGGEGLGIHAHARISQAFAEQCGTVGLCYTMHNVALKFIMTFAEPELRSQIIREVVEENKFLSLARSESGTGVHVFHSQMGVSEHAEESVLNGIKFMVTSANYADYYLISVPQGDNPLPVNWLIPYKTDGLSFKESDWHGVGMRGNNSCPMVMDNMTLNNRYKVTIDRQKANQQYPVNIDVIYFMAGLAGVYTGVCQALFTAAKEHAMSRKYPQDKSLASIETVQIHLATIYANAQTAESSLIVATTALEHGEDNAFVDIMTARITASLNSIESANLAMRIGGGRVYNKQGSIERLMRDAYASQVMFPSVDVLKTWTARVLTGQPLA